MANAGFRVPLRDGAEIFCRVLGPEDAPALCLVPGLGGLAAFWSAVAPALSQRFRVVLHDHRGTGESTPSRITYSIGQMADDLCQVLAALGIGRTSIVGHSTGGAIAQTIALDQPERVRALVLSSTWAGPDPYFTALFRLRIEVLRRIGPGAYSRFGALLLKPPADIARNPEELAVSDEQAVARLHDTEIVASRIEALLAHDRRGDLEGIAQPALITCACDDHVTPPHMSEELARLIRNAHLSTCAEGGHFLPQTRPERFLQTIMPFLLSAGGAE